jgi:hypothetical protein
MFCPYCATEKDAQEFTDEHVLPRALGGALHPTNPFKLRVCQQCNAIAGLYVDAPVVRSWLLRLARASALIDPLDPVAPAMHLQFVGRLEAWEDADTICDYWLGPTGDSVFHFHRPYEGESTFVGGRPGLRPADLDPGVVLVGIVATNPVWHPIIFRSLKDAFDRSKIYALNANPRGDDRIPPELERHVAWIESLPPSRRTALSLDLKCGERFTAKVALGIGSILLGADYQASSDAALLRKYMRSKDAVERAGLNLRGTALLGLAEDETQLLQTFAWRACHTVAVMPVNEQLSCVVVLYGAHPMVINLTSDPALWRGRVGEAGIAWMIAPGLRTFAGPVSVPELLIDVAASEPSGPLRALTERLLAIPALPPAHLPSRAAPSP